MATQLSPHFTLEELLFSQTAVRKQFTEQFTPPADVVENLRQLCIHVLEPLRNAIGYPVRVTSGYRCPRLNKLIGGAPKSQHQMGMAADLVDNKNGNKYLFDKIKELGLPFDQIIDEFGYQWVHVSYDRTKATQRGQSLQAIKKGNGQTGYIEI